MYTSYLYEERLKMLCAKPRPLVLHHEDSTYNTDREKTGETQHKGIRCGGKQPFHLTALFTDLCKYWIMREDSKIHPLYGVLGFLPFVQ